ncbi:rho GTPase-activating protein 19-like [Drosophila miranda]|uniref:rho GTPase-activating protein 19-like n=1 Tax=Drosophila miranda TaxID=7229 RepID=UPI00143F1620|nr:rho GTPase-activating protein 19-like [Drosophila miranda]
MDMEYANINEFNDRDLATRMRNSNYEKYKSLVRMHLSFELELNTDEFDMPCHEIVYEDKGKIKKWNRLSKKNRGPATGCTAGAGSKSAGNSPTETLQQQIDAGFLMHLEELKEFFMLEKNLSQEGLFRKTGAVSRQNELRMHIQHDQPLDLELTGFSAHDCATVFKSFLAELPEPLLTDAHYPAHLQIAPLSQALMGGQVAATAERQQHLLNSVQLLLLLLPEEHRELLQHIIKMLHSVAAREESNKMSAENLAILFTPHLICPRQMPPKALHYTAKKMSSIVSYMIQQGLEIFEVPGKLATDIRAYFLERKRKKTMSPEQTLEESISDDSTVNTVYTFVDRAATAAANNSNYTDTALAQLYAHIQSLPESSKKRRLIKQFNKQNGQGTPLQVIARSSSVP